MTKQDLLNAMINIDSEDEICFWVLQDDNGESINGAATLFSVEKTIGDDVYYLNISDEL